MGPRLDQQKKGMFNPPNNGFEPENNGKQNMAKQHELEPSKDGDMSPVWRNFARKSRGLCDGYLKQR